MIQGLKNDDIIHKVGGRFKLTSLIQKRWLEILRGAAPMVDKTGKTDLEVVIEEILQGKVGIDYDASNLPRPEEIIRPVK